jgi:hypothetical protein
MRFLDGSSGACRMMLPRSHELIHRLADTEMSGGPIPISYDRDSHTVEAVISMGSPVKRDFGTEVLRIAPDAVDLSRMEQGGIPLLDHHSQSGIDSILGKLVDVWFDRSALVGASSSSPRPHRARRPRAWSAVARSVASAPATASMPGRSPTLMAMWSTNATFGGTTT